MTKTATEVSEADAKKRISARKKRMQRMITSLQHYMDTYTDYGDGRFNQTDKAFIDDVLYGLGTAIDPHLYQYADGYDKFQSFLRQHLGTEPK